MPWGAAIGAVGALGAAAIGSGNKPSGQVSQTGSSSPWEPYGAQLSNLYGSTERAWRDGSLTPSYYGGQTYAGLTPEGSGALQSMYGNQTAGNLLNTGSGQIGQTAGGAYTQGGTQNPFFQGAFQGIADQIRPAIDSSFESAGRFGSGAADYAKASALTNAGMQMGFQNYGQERQNQLNAAGLTPQMAQASYIPAQMQLGAAQTQQADTQGQFNADKARYDYNSNMPYMALQRYQGLLTNPGSGGSTMQNSPFFQPSPVQNAIGGALGGAAVGRMVGQNGGGLNMTAPNWFNNLVGGSGSIGNSQSFLSQPNNYPGGF